MAKKKTRSTDRKGLAPLGGVAGAAAVMATVFLALLSSLPDAFWKKWLLYATPLLCYSAATAVQHTLVALGRSIARWRLSRDSRQLKKLIHASLGDPSTSDAHKAVLQTRLEELQLLEVESRLARIRKVLEAEASPARIGEVLDADSKLARMGGVVARIRELASISAPETEDSLQGTLSGVGSSDQAVGHP